MKIYYLFTASAVFAAKLFRKLNSSCRQQDCWTSSVYYSILEQIYAVNELYYYTQKTNGISMHFVRRFCTKMWALCVCFYLRFVSSLSVSTFCKIISYSFFCLKNIYTKKIYSNTKWWHFGVFIRKLNI